MTQPAQILDQIFSIPIERNKFLVYAPLRKTAFLANAALLNMIHDRCSRPAPNGGGRTPSSKLDMLERLNFFRPAPLPGDRFGAADAAYDAVVLFLTNECPLRCVYCYASTGDYAVKKMPWEIAKSAIDFVADKASSNPSSGMTLGFHGGGDPALNWNVLTRSVAYAGRRTTDMGISLKVTASFNGYWERPKRDYVLNNFTEISLSFDGVPDVQNIQRPVKTGRGSFSRVLTSLKAMDDAHFPYGIRMTVTGDSVRRLPESVDFICGRFAPRKIQVEPVFPSGRAGRNPAAGVDPDEFVSAFAAAYSIARSRGIPLFYSGARLEILTRRFCECAGRALVVTPEGLLTSCFEVFGPEHPLSRTFLVGSYRRREGFLVDERKRSGLLARTVETDPKCRTCFCKWHCAGDCAAKSGADDDRDSPRCRLNRELTKFLILDRIKEVGGLIWIGSEENGAGRPTKGATHESPQENELPASKSPRGRNARHAETL